MKESKQTRHCYDCFDTLCSLILNSETSKSSVKRLEHFFVLRATVCKDQTKSEICGKVQIFYGALILDLS